MVITPRRTVLVIDDDPTIRDLIEALLTDEGYLVLQAEHGQQAVLLARERQPSVILLDGILPELSGHEILRMLRAGAATRHIPIVLLRSLPWSNTDDQVPEVCINKPFDLNVLLAHVNRMAAVNETLVPASLN